MPALPESTMIRRGVRALIAATFPDAMIFETVDELAAFELQLADCRSAVGLHFIGWDKAKDEMAGQRGTDPRVFSVLIVLGARSYRSWIEAIEILEEMELSLGAIRTQKVCRIGEQDVYLKLNKRTTDTPAETRDSRGGPVRFVIPAETEVIYL